MRAPKTWKGFEMVSPILADADDAAPLTRETLLNPTLSGEGKAQPLFSVTALFFTAVFGGPIAIIIFSYLNAMALGRGAMEAMRYLVTTLVSILVLGFIFSWSEIRTPGSWLAGVAKDDVDVIVNVAYRVYGILVWHELYRRHRQFYAAAELLLAKPRSPWGIAFLCVIAGAFLGPLLGGLMLIFAQKVF